MFGISVTEWMFILIVVLVLFGGKKIPELARSLGKGVSEFKKGIREVEGELHPGEITGTQVHTQSQPQLPPAQPAETRPFRFDPYTGKPLTADSTTKTE